MLRKNQILYMYMIINGGIITAKRETTAGRKHIITPDSVQRIHNVILEDQ